MKVPRLLASVALVAAFSATLLAQQAPTGYHSCCLHQGKAGKQYRVPQVGC